MSMVTDQTVMDPDSDVEFTDDQHEIWKTLYARQAPQVLKFACREYLEGSRRLQLPSDKIGVNVGTQEGCGPENQLGEHGIEGKMFLSSGHTQQRVDRNLKHRHTKTDGKERRQGNVKARGQ